MQRDLNALVPGWLSFNSTVAWAHDSLPYAGNDAVFSREVAVARSSDGVYCWQE